MKLCKSYTKSNKRVWNKVNKSYKSLNNTLKCKWDIVFRSIIGAEGSLNSRLTISPKDKLNWKNKQNKHHDLNGFFIFTLSRLPLGFSGIRARIRWTRNRCQFRLRDTCLYRLTSRSQFGRPRSAQVELSDSFRTLSRTSQRYSLHLRRESPRLSYH